MTGRQFAAALGRLEISQRAAARLMFHVNERTVRDWVEKGPPNPVALCISLMLGYGITAAAAQALAARIFR